MNRTLRDLCTNLSAISHLVSSRLPSRVSREKYLGMNLRPNNIYHAMLTLSQQILGNNVIQPLLGSIFLCKSEFANDTQQEMFTIFKEILCKHFTQWETVWNLSSYRLSRVLLYNIVRMTGLCYSPWLATAWIPLGGSIIQFE